MIGVFVQPIPTNRSSITVKFLQKLGIELENEFPLKISFHQIAYKYLTDLKNIFDWNEKEFLRDFLLNCESRQLDPCGQLGQPPMTVYFSGKNKFCIDIYLLNNKIIENYELHFEGALILLQGELLLETFNSELSPSKLEIIAPSHVQCLLPHSNLIQRLVHTRSPSYALVLRTTKEDSNAPPDYVWVKYRLGHYAYRNNIISFENLKNINIFKYKEFSNLFHDDEEFRKEFPDIYSEDKINQIFDLYFNKLNEGQKTLLVNLNFFRNKIKIMNWYEDNNRNENINECFTQLLIFFIDQKVITENLLVPLNSLWHLGLKKALPSLSGEDFLLLKTESTLRILPFLNFLLKQKSNP